MIEKHLRLRAAILSASLLGSLAMAVLAARAQPGEAEPTQPAPSQYAPAEDLLRMIDMTFEDIEKDLSDPEDYGPAQQARVTLAANELIALALTLDNHDQENPLQIRSADFMDASAELVCAADDYEAATVAFGNLREEFQRVGPGDPVEWGAEADIALLMKQVPIVNNDLRRGVGGRRFERNTEKNLALAAALASIAQASRYDMNYAFDDEAAAQWQQICDEMRDACAAVAEAVRQGDQDTAKQGLDRIVETCDACHHQFRD